MWLMRDRVQRARAVDEFAVRQGRTYKYGQGVSRCGDGILDREGKDGVCMLLQRAVLTG